MSSRPCPQCRSNNHDSKGDHLFLMKDGVTWGCFHKDYHLDRKNYFEKEDGTVCSFPSGRENTGGETVEDILSFPLLSQECRGIRGEVYNAFEARISFDETNGKARYLYFPIKSKGELVGFHRRDVESKSFINIGNIAGRELDLFGYDKCAKSGKNIVITEGHMDALSVYQAVKDKYSKVNPNIVSLNNGLGSIKDIASNVANLNSYDNVLICFDMDKPGRDGVAKVAKILGSKMKVMELSCKDANDALVAKRDHEIISAIFNPREYVPSDVLTLMDIHDSILEETPQGIPFPWDGLNEITYGIFDRQIISIGAAAGSGKALRHGERVLVDGGDKRIEDIIVGDLVQNTYGGLSNVIGVFPQGVRNIYRVSFTDGTALDVDEDHLWTFVRTKDGKEITLTTKEASLRYTQGVCNRKVFYLPSYLPQDTDDVDFIINPYLLGAWLGDGSNSNATISCPRGKIRESCMNNFPWSYDEKYQCYRIRELKTKLKKLGVFENKHIPECYFFGSIAQRRELLQGLLDTDGSDAGRGGICFDNSNEGIVDGVIRLARSLGYISKRRKTKEITYYRNSDGDKVYCKPCYRCVIKVVGGRTSKRYVSDISYLCKDYATCISVDSDNRLFMAGDFIPTHNTVWMNQLSAYLMREYKKKIALFSLEETPAYTGKKLIGSLIHKKIHLPGVRVSQEEIKEVYESIKDYLYIYDTQGYLSWEDIKTNIRYLASLGVTIFVIDPLTAVTAMCSASEANEVLNGMMADLSSLVQSLCITVFLVSHLNNPKTGKMHSEGARVSGEQFTQSRALQRWSHLVLGLERNLQAEDEEEKNTLTVRVIKNRLVGHTGTVALRYDDESGRLEEIDEIGYGL